MYKGRYRVVDVGQGVSLLYKEYSGSLPKFICADGKRSGSLFTRFNTPATVIIRSHKLWVSHRRHVNFLSMAIIILRLGGHANGFKSCFCRKPWAANDRNAIVRP